MKGDADCIIKKNTHTHTHKTSKEIQVDLERSGIFRGCHCCQESCNQKVAECANSCVCGRFYFYFCIFHYSYFLFSFKYPDILL